MSKTKHTEGPWFWEGMDIKRNGRLIASIYGVTSPNGDANARLIAAAPELLEALQNIVNLDEDAHPGLMTWYEARSAAHDRAKAVIAKAQEGS